MSVQSRIIGLVLTLFLLMFFGAGFAWRQINLIGGEIHIVTEDNIPLSSVVADITATKLEQALHLERAFRLGMRADRAQDTSLIPFREAQSEFARLSKDVRISLTRGQEVAKLAAEKVGRAEFKRALEQLNRINTAYSEYERSAGLLIDQLGKGALKEAEIGALTLSGQEERLREALRSLSETVDKAMSYAAERASAVQHQALAGMLSFAFVSGLFGISLAYLLALSITRPLLEAVEIAHKIGSGEKEIIFPTGKPGEVGTLLNALKEMLESLRSSETELIRQTERLARSNSELEQFAYVASHDLQEPLRMVASYVQLLERRYKDKLDSEATEFIQFAVGGVTRMQALIQDLLSYSRVGRIERKPVVFPATRAVKQALRQLQASIDESSAIINFKELPELYGDESLIIQVFQNLIGNAIKFSCNRRPEIEISSQSSPEGPVISVCDKGIGIEERYIERIFQIFQRLHGQGEYSGTGVGLAIVKKIIERHRGRIWVTSVLGAGSCFHFCLPPEQFNLEESV